MTNVYDILEERGYIEQSTDPGIRDLLGNESVTFYVVLTPLPIACTWAISFKLW